MLASLSLSSSPRIRTYTDDTRFAAPPIVIYAPLCDHLGRIFLPPSAFSTRPRDKREVKIRSIRGYIPSISFVTPDWLAASIRRDSASVFLGQVNFHVRSGQRFLHQSRLDIGQRGLVSQRNHEEVDSRRPVKPIEPWTRIS